MAANRNKQAADNRLLMPECSRVIDEFRDVFGADQIKVTYASENGIELGKRDPAFVRDEVTQ